MFDDLSANPADWLLAQEAEAATKPPLYRSAIPIIHRPFEDAEWFNAISWPFNNWQKSRFSDGSYGIWYGSESIATTIYETVIAERKVYSVTCSAALLDFRKITDQYPDLLHPPSYAFAQSVGTRIHREGHPGLVIQSVRSPVGENFAIFNPAVLSLPKQTCQLTYRLEADQIVVEKQPGKAWLTLDLAGFC